MQCQLVEGEGVKAVFFRKKDVFFPAIKVWGGGGGWGTAIKKKLFSGFP